MKIKVSLKNRFKQIFCKHDRTTSLSCCSEGINGKQGFWYMTYECYECGFAFGEWVEADRAEMEKHFEREVYKIK